MGMPPDECPCKYKLGFGGNDVPASITVIPQGTETPIEYVGTINFSSEECFTGGPNCNPNVDGFTISFGDNTEPNTGTINISGVRGTIACTDNTVAFMFDGQGDGTGSAIPNQTYSVDFTYTITGPPAVTFTFTAIGADGTVVQTTVPVVDTVSSQTFIGDCDEQG